MHCLQQNALFEKQNTNTKFFWKTDIQTKFFLSNSLRHHLFHYLQSKKLTALLKLILIRIFLSIKMILNQNFSKNIIELLWRWQIFLWILASAILLSNIILSLIPAPENCALFPHQIEDLSWPVDKIDNHSNTI